MTGEGVPLDTAAIMSTVLEAMFYGTLMVLYGQWGAYSS